MSATLTTLKARKAEILRQLKDLHGHMTWRPNGPTAEQQRIFDALIDEGNRIKSAIEREESPSTRASMQATLDNILRNERRR